MVARDRAEGFRREDWNACAEFGVQGMPIPQEYGGLGLGIVSLIAVMEGLGYGCQDSGLLFSLNAHLWTNSIPILLYGTEAAAPAVPAGPVRRHADRRQRRQRAGRRSDVFSMRTRPSAAATATC